MKTKTIKTPSVGLILFQSLCAQCYDSVFKSTLLRQSHTTRHTHWRGSSPQKEKPQKTIHSVQYVSYNQNGFYCFSSEDVFSCRATSDDGRACAGVCSQAQNHAVSTKARSAKTSAEGFFRFLLTSETCINDYISFCSTEKWSFRSCFLL